MKRLTLSLLLLLAFASANAAVTGKVINRTTGQPASGIPVTLIKMQISMDPVDEVFTNNAPASSMPAVSSSNWCRVISARVRSRT